MSGISDIISITISRETQVPSQAGLGFTNFVSALADFADTIKSYASLAEVNADDDVGSDSEQFALEYFGQNPRPKKLYVTKKGVGTYAAALDAASIIDDDWYGVAIASRVKADILAIAAWTEPKFKYFVGASAEAGVLVVGTTDDVASTLQDSAYERTAYFYHSQAATRYPEACLMGKQFPKVAGSSSYVYKTLAGLPIDTLTSAQKASAISKNAYVYTARGGINMTEGGKSSSGEWTDVITGIDDLTVDQESRIFGKIVASEKVPFDNGGIAKIVSAVRESLMRSVANGVLAADPEFIITYPLASEVSASNKSTRTLEDIEWEATLAGAIHKVTVQGRVVL